MADYMLTLEFDHDTECPMDFSSAWTLVSFNRHSIHYGDPSFYLHEKHGGEQVPATIGLRSRFRAGLAYFLDYYEHGQGKYSFTGEGPQCRWDTASPGGILLWEHSPKELNPSREDRRKDAQCFLDSYNTWMNGEALWYSLEDSEGSYVSSCGGFLEHDFCSVTIGEHLKPGDRLKVKGEAASCLDESKLPIGVEIVEDFEDEEILQD